MPRKPGEFAAWFPNRQHVGYVSEAANPIQMALWIDEGVLVALINDDGVGLVGER